MNLSHTLEEKLSSILAAHRGRVALFAANLVTGAEIDIDADRVVQAASTIKLAILYAAVEEIRAGRASWSDRLTLKASDQVPRSGVLLFFDTPMQLTLKDALTLMISMSDNTATNLVIDYLGLDCVNACIVRLGLSNTRLYRKVFCPPSEAQTEEQQRFGLGKTTPREMARLMQIIFDGNFSPASSANKNPAAEHSLAPKDQDEDKNLREVMLPMLRNQFYRDGIPRYLGRLYTDNESRIANKTGELNAVRNDVATIESSRGTLILSIFTFENEDESWSVENEGEVTIGKLARAIVEAWSPEDS